MYKYQNIKMVHLENTQNCQASCPMCDRNQNGGQINSHINLSELSINDIKIIFQPNFIKQLNTIYMCGNLGDPIIAKDTLEIFQYFRENNSNLWLSMNTNAGARDKEWWTELAKIFGKMGTVIFSVDGLEDTNHLYRQGVIWQNVENSFKSFIESGGRARWDFLIFDHNQHQVEQARELSKSWGFEKFIAKKTGRFVTSNVQEKKLHQAVDRKGTKTTELKKPKKEYQNAAVQKLPDLINKYGSMDNYYDNVPIKCKVKEDGNLFITAEGLALPCCWVAGRMYKWWHTDPKVEQVWNFIDKVGGKSMLDAKKHGLEKIFDTNIFDLIEDSWTKKTCKEGKLKVCAMKCGQEFDPFGEQFK